VGIFYDQEIAVSGGCPIPNKLPPYLVSLDSGSLPVGLYLTGGSSNVEVLGSPTHPGVSSFTLKATDWAGQTITKAFTMTINVFEAIVTGSCANNPGISSYGGSGYIAPPGGSRRTAGFEMENAAAILNLITNLEALGCTCPPLQINVDPMGAHTTFHNNGGSCTIMIHIDGYSPDLSVGPGVTVDWGQQYFNDNGMWPSGLKHFHIGGGVTFDSTY
jgi:hypothetical protein